MSKDTFGRTELPEHVSKALRRARTLELVSIVWLMITVTAVALTMGSSQAMKAAWMEDMLSFLPPLAFLVALRQVRREPDDGHPYGYHRAVGAGHLAASVALLAMGGFLAFDSAMTLLKREHPTVGTVQLFGHTVWLGWLMIVVMVVTNIPTVILGRLKLKVAETLHDKILYADADMNKADYTTAAGTCLGILGIGMGWWWADSAVALLISGSIIKDGWTNLSNALKGLLDHQAKTYDDKDLHPLLGAVEGYARQLPWGDDVRVRLRDKGHVFHGEVLVKTRAAVGVDELDRATRDIRSLDWKLKDTVVVPVKAFPHDDPE